MAAIETPWVSGMAPASVKATENGSANLKPNEDPNPPTIAAFSPNPTSTFPAAKQRSTLIVHRKSPLLVATPPSITRALAFSHPFLLPLNKLVGLISWTSGDPWESFLLVAGFWALTLYGDVVILWTGPLLVVVGLILGMYSRRYSPLSSTGWTGEKLKGHKKAPSESSMRHQKSLDEIVDTLTAFTSRCNVLLEPFLQMTDFLSTQRTATSASTRPALTTLLIRILFITPIWVSLTWPPLRIITTRRTVLAMGTLILSWHSRPARVSRAILWRSRLVRRISSIVTGLSFASHIPIVQDQQGTPPPLPPRVGQHAVANSLASGNQVESSGVRFTFVVFENQRRWLGLGWTSSLLAYERAAWTDEHLNPSDAKQNFRLPEVDSGVSKWRWVPGSDWQVEGAGKGKAGGDGDGWIYYDNKWNDGRRGQDGWGRYTRRRKWYRDAELVEIPPGTETESSDTLVASTEGSPPESAQSIKETDDTSSSLARRRRFLRRDSRTSARSSASHHRVGGSEDEADHRGLASHQERVRDWGVGDDVRMGFG